MDTIIKQVHALAATADVKTHREVIDIVRQLLHSIERPEDTAHRLIHGV